MFWKKKSKPIQMCETHHMHNDIIHIRDGTANDCARGGKRSIFSLERRCCKCNYISFTKEFTEQAGLSRFVKNINVDGVPYTVSYGFKGDR